MKSSRVAWMFGVLSVFLALAPAGGSAAEKKEPPSCAAISFRPLTEPPADGNQRAGLYKSRFARIELNAVVQGGQAVDYYMLVDGKRPEALNTAPSRTVEACLKSKHVVVPVKAMTGPCTGARFRVVIDRSGKDRLAMLFGLQGNEWHMCSAARI